MFKLILLLSVIGFAVGLKIHEHGYEHQEHHYSEPAIEETEHHQEVEHKHATSHQSVKFHHFHAVPVYIKKEDQHLLKNPIEIGGSKQKLKILHPETPKSHSHGLVLENHSESHIEEHGHHEHEPIVHEHSHYEEQPHLEHYEHYGHE